MIVVKNPNCRKCGRALVDESDLLVGLCNNDDACHDRVLKKSTTVMNDDELAAHLEAQGAPYVDQNS